MIARSYANLDRMVGRGGDVSRLANEPIGERESSALSGLKSESTPRTTLPQPLRDAINPEEAPVA